VIVAAASVHRLPELPPRRLANCLRIQLMAFAYDGAWREYTVAQAVGLTRVPDNVPLEQAAILADAVSTPFGAVVRTGKVGIGESVGVWASRSRTHIVNSRAGRRRAGDRGRHQARSPRSRRRTRADYAFDARDEGLRDKIAISPAAGCSMWRSTRSA